MAEDLLFNKYELSRVIENQRDDLLDGFERKLNISKWAKIAKCSQDTALRDIKALITLGILEKGPGGGRSTSYALVESANASV